MTTYEDMFAALMDQVEQDQEARKAFAEDPVSVLKNAGIPLVPILEVPPESKGFNLTALKPEDLKISFDAGDLIKPGLKAATGVKVGKHWCGV